MQRILVGNYILRFKSLKSTNDFCKEYIRDKGPAALSAAVITDEQTSGKGQRGNVWHAQKGKNLTFSAICDTSFLKTAEVFYINKAVSVAIIRFLAEYNIQAQIKWPNDIYVNNKKLGGILIENSIQGSNFSHSILGIGLNVNQVDFPPELKACSMIALTGESYELDVIFENLLDKLDEAIWSIKQNLKNLDNYYFNHLLGLNSNGVFKDNNGVFSGFIRNVSENGLLQIEVSEGIRDFNFKELSFLL